MFLFGVERQLLCKRSSHLYVFHAKIIALSFSFYDLLVRQKTKDLIDFIQDDDRLREERKKAKKNKDKYIGMSGELAGFSRGFSKYSSNLFSTCGRSAVKELVFVSGQWMCLIEFSPGSHRLHILREVTKVVFFHISLRMLECISHSI